MPGHYRLLVCFLPARISTNGERRDNDPQKLICAGAHVQHIQLDKLLGRYF